MHEAAPSDECRGQDYQWGCWGGRWQATQFSLRALTGKIESQSHGPGNQCHDTVMTYVISGIIVTTSCCAHRVRSFRRGARRQALKPGHRLERIAMERRAGDDQ